ncbi:MAG: transposase [Bacteroidota bacterium]
MEAGKVYHIYNRGNNKQNIFFEDENYSFFLKRFDKYLAAKMDVLAYCLMPNHFHLLVRIKIIDGISDNGIAIAVAKAFRNFLISYTKAINKKYDRTGVLFQPKYKRAEVDNDFYFSWLIQYVHMNPVIAGLCKNPEDWKYSSYTAILGDKATKISVKEVREWFGGVAEFIRIHNERVIDKGQCRNCDLMIEMHTVCVLQTTVVWQAQPSGTSKTTVVFIRDPKSS